jgi:uncharacterized iron-regulated membrane protein
MNGSFRRTMIWLHGWAGLLAGWLLYSIFLTGSASYYRQEISQWMRPELRPPAVAFADASVVASAVRSLRTMGADADRWRIILPTARTPTAEIYMWRRSGNGPRFIHELLDPSTGEPAHVRATLGGDFLYYFHFDLQAPSIWGRLLVGLAAILMLVALVSGIVTHRRIFVDFFTFRPRSAASRAWLDAHNVTGVLVLPFHFVITYTGLVTLMFLYMPWGGRIAYNGDEAAFFAEAGVVAPTPAAGAPAPLAAIAPLLEEARRRWNGGRVGVIDIYRPEDTNTRIELTREASETLAYRYDRLLFEGPSGQLAPESEPPPAAATYKVMYGLHIGRFAESWLRAILFLCGLAASAMIATGLVLWSILRRERHSSSLVRRLVERLDLSVIIGLPIAIAGYFWANRLLPFDAQNRLFAEPLAFFLTWLSVSAASFLTPRRAPWTAMLWIAALAFGALPFVDAFGAGHAALAALDRLFVAFDSVLLASGLAFGAIAWTLRGRPLETLRGSRKKESAA